MDLVGLLSGHFPTAMFRPLLLLFIILLAGQWAGRSVHAQQLAVLPAPTAPGGGPARCLRTTFYALDSVAGTPPGCAGKSDGLVGYRRWDGERPAATGLYVRGLCVEATVAAEGTGYVLGVGNPTGRVPRLFLDCATMVPRRPVNNRQDGRKAGLWLRGYGWGGVRRAVQYEAGHPLRAVYFRPNGKLARVQEYRNGKKRRGGTYYYNKEGYLTNGMMPF